LIVLVSHAMSYFPEDVEKDLNLTYHPNVESMVRVGDMVTINAPLHPETEHLFNDALINKMKRGAYLVNTARGKICDRDLSYVP
jgi:formate dehydrogenase